MRKLLVTINHSSEMVFQICPHYHILTSLTLVWITAISQIILPSVLPMSL